MSGLVAALAAFFTWGLLPLYWKELVHVSPYEVVCHRVIWSCVFTAVLLFAMRKWKEVGRVLRSPRDFLGKVVVSILLFANWLAFIYAVTSDYVLEASLGYYICPLVFALMSRVFFRDTLRPLQIAAIVLAFLGVANQVINYGEMPWIAISLALLFAFYGLINKVVPVGPVPGLFLETAIMSVAALSYVIYLGSQNRSAFLSIDPHTDFFLLCAGVATVLPLLGFSFAAKRLKLVTVGMCQFIVPTCFFLLGVLVFKEPFTSTHLVTFVLIWVGIACYLAESIIHSKKIAR